MEHNFKEEIQKKYSKIVAKAWADDDQKKKLLANAEVVLKKEGFEIPAGLKIQIIEESENTKIFVLPRAPLNFDKIEDLEKRFTANSAASGPCGCSPHDAPPLASSW